VISALLYLNDVQGGETHFTYFNTSVSPKAGRLVVFPSNYAYTHEAYPPIEGYKYVCVFWTREF
jgi:prolyl 4-hydroxylase